MSSSPVFRARAVRWKPTGGWTFTLPMEAMYVCDDVLAIWIDKESCYISSISLFSDARISGSVKSTTLLRATTRTTFQVPGEGRLQAPGHRSQVPCPACWSGGHLSREPTPPSLPCSAMEEAKRPHH